MTFDPMKEAEETVFDSSGIACPQTSYQKTCEKDNPCICCKSAVNLISKALTKAYAEGVETERERCARVAEVQGCRYNSPSRCCMETEDGVVWPHQCTGCRVAQAIRNRPRG